MSSDPDREFVLRCQDPGSEEYETAFDALYQRYKDQVYSLAFRILGNRADALDAAQEAFVLVYQKIGSFQFESKFSSWLYRLVTNTSIDQLRRKRTRQRRRHVSLERDIPSEQHQETYALVDESLPEAGSTLEGQELANQIQASILRLSPKLRVITVLRYQQSLSYEELAETLELSLGTVKSRLARAHIALAEHLRPLIAEQLIAEQQHSNSARGQKLGRQNP